MQIQQVLPTAEQIAALQNYPTDQAITMVNIIKYRAHTEEGLSGRALYQRYIENIYPLIQKAKGRLVWQGDVAQMVIGDENGKPDQIFLVEYPSVTNFLEMIASPAYQAIGKDRTLALEYGGLIACQPSPQKP